VALFHTANRPVFSWTIYRDGCIVSPCHAGTFVPNTIFGAARNTDPRRATQRV
jgi:hypothetical protein